MSIDIILCKWNIKINQNKQTNKKREQQKKRIYKKRVLISEVNMKALSPTADFPIAGAEAGSPLDLSPREAPLEIQDFCFRSDQWNFVQKNSKTNRDPVEGSHDLGVWKPSKKLSCWILFEVRSRATFPQCHKEGVAVVRSKQNKYVSNCYVFTRHCVYLS